MDVLFYHPSFDADIWQRGVMQRLPNAHFRRWQPGDDAPADYALVRSPPLEMLQHRGGLKGVFALGAGVDDILGQLRQHPTLLHEDTPLLRLEDTGMARQMQEYAVYTVLGWFRRFDDYQLQKQQAHWQRLENYPRDRFTVGVLGAGVLGSSVARSLASWGFPVRCWSRSPKQIDGVTPFYGNDRRADFLRDCRVLINLLPDTPETQGIIDHALLSQLPSGAFVLNMARGTHLVEADLLQALESGQIKGAALDVFATEPLPSDSPLWRHPRVAITPHNAAITLPDEALDFICTAITALENGETPAGIVDRSRGY